jgi:hypothetical protein
MDRRYYRRFSMIDPLPVEELQEAVGAPDPARISILLAHDPTQLDTYFAYGADITLCGRTALVRGASLHAAWVDSTDLRGGAALVVAALAARGTSRVGALEHIDRGYEALDWDLARLGAGIERKDDRRRNRWQQDATSADGTKEGDASASSIKCCPSSP